MVSAGNVSLLYVAFGIIASALVSISSFKLKLIEEKSELLYLSFGFYRNFIKIYLKRFPSAVRLILDLAFSRKKIRPIIYSVKFNDQNSVNPALLMASVNMTTGLFSIEFKDSELLIHAINQDYFKNFDLLKTIALLKHTNDDNLI